MKKKTLKFKRDVIGDLSPSQLTGVAGGITSIWFCGTTTEPPRSTCVGACTNTQPTCGSCSSETIC